MPISYEIDACGVFITTFVGELTMSDFAEYFARSEADPRFKPELQRLVIASGATAYPSGAQVVELSKRIRTRTNPGARFAVVASSPASVGLANLFLVQAGVTGSFEIFPDRATAMKWLAQLRNTP